MFYIIKTPRNYFTRELLHDSNVAFHCIVSHWRPYWEVSCSGKYSAGPVLPLWFTRCFSECSTFAFVRTISTLTARNEWSSRCFQLHIPHLNHSLCCQKASLTNAIVAFTFLWDLPSVAIVVPRYLCYLFQLITRGFATTARNIQSAHVAAQPRVYQHYIELFESGNINPFWISAVGFNVLENIHGGI